MRNRGKLYVFEGPDGVGKSEISTRLTQHLRCAGVRCEHFASPGCEQGTLGNLVYELHHAQHRHGIASLTPTSLQLLHVAAHIDAIEARILPALQAGATVVLDRFWWSTRVYGLAFGIARRTLDSIIDIELAAWQGVKPAAVFLMHRGMPLRTEPLQEWERYKDLYKALAADERRHYRVHVIKNEGSSEETLAAVMSLLGEQVLDPRDDTAQLVLNLSGGVHRSRAPRMFSSLSPAKPTEVFDTYLRFAVERQRVFLQRMSGAAPPWSDDPILLKYKFTNTYRASDRVSQFLIRHVIYEGDQAPDEVFFRILLFKLFNKIETWQLLTGALGSLRHSQFSLAAYDEVLSTALASGHTIYSAAYIMPAGSRVPGSSRKHRAHLQLLECMMKDELPWRIADTKTMLDAFRLLRSYPMIGDFLAYQYVTDLNYSTLIDFSEMEFVVPGPGARSGIRKCFQSLGGLDEASLIKAVTERQREEFARLGLEFPLLGDRPLQLIDCQNLFCEVDKYSRIKHPEVAGIGDRTRIKQKFSWNTTPIKYWYPPKWDINDKILSARPDVTSRHLASRAAT